MFVVIEKLADARRGIEERETVSFAERQANFIVQKTVFCMNLNKTVEKNSKLLSLREHKIAYSVNPRYGTNVPETDSKQRYCLHLSIIT